MYPAVALIHPPKECPQITGLYGLWFEKRFTLSATASISLAKSSEL